MYILGISAYHGDCSACLIKDGRMIAAVEEERFRRVKHWAGFPAESVRYCLEEGKITVDELDHVAVGRNPRAHAGRKLLFVLTNPRSLGKVKDRYDSKKRIEGVGGRLSGLFGKEIEKNKIHYIEHHKAHMASAFLVSPFEESAIISLDGFGDFVSCMMGKGEDNKIRVLKTVHYPHSIGLFYTMITQFLGFNKYGDEYKVMGLAPYGRPTYKDKLKRIIRYAGAGAFRSDLSFFTHHVRKTDVSGEDGEPGIRNIFSEKLIKEFGPARNSGEKLTEYHRDIAASLQAHTEDLIFALLNHLHEKTGCKNVCLAGGVAMNSVANGKIFDNTPFEEVYIQPAAGDAGTSLGAAYYLYNHVLGRKRDFVMDTSYWGPMFGDDQIKLGLDKKNRELEDAGCGIDKIEDEGLLCGKVAEFIAGGKVVGWFQGRMEWAPRALGNRSVLADPRDPNMKDTLNTRIKKRETFRPFAPSILEEKVGEYFQIDHPDPFMTKVYPVKEEKRALIPAVTHIDGTGRLQTVSRKQNSRYWLLLKEFERITGVPVLLNTSFNENEPIVCGVEEALDCFLRTGMDVLVLGDFIIKKIFKEAT